jgi:hypothetical protein
MRDRHDTFRDVKSTDTFRIFKVLIIKKKGMALQESDKKKVNLCAEDVRGSGGIAKPFLTSELDGGE